jgi:hypothetical protein
MAGIDPQTLRLLVSACAAPAMPRKALQRNAISSARNYRK